MNITSTSRCQCVRRRNKADFRSDFLLTNSNILRLGNKLVAGAKKVALWVKGGLIAQGGGGFGDVIVIGLVLSLSRICKHDSGLLIAEPVQSGEPDLYSHRNSIAP